MARYRADITAGSLKIPESRIVAELLLSGVNDHQWEKAIKMDNLLQARNPATAVRISRLIRQRLTLMKPELWRLVKTGSSSVTTHACLAAAVKQSTLLGDFLDLVVREQYKLFTPALSKKHWEDYIEGCHARDPEMPWWSESTITRLRSTVFQILAQAGYIEDTKVRRLQKVYIAPEVIGYLKENCEDYVLRCIQVGP